MRGSESSPSSMAPISSEKVLATRLRWYVLARCSGIRFGLRRTVEDIKDGAFHLARNGDLVRTCAGWRRFLAFFWPIRRGFPRKNQGLPRLGPPRYGARPGRFAGAVR